MKLDHAACNRTVKVVDMNIVTETRSFMKQMCKRFRNSKRRRACASWSVPNEIWLILTLPNYRLKLPNMLGIGKYEDGKAHPEEKVMFSTKQFYDIFE